MSIFESITVSLFCISLVFVLLACLFFLVRILTGVLGAIDKRKNRNVSASKPYFDEFVEEDDDTVRNDFSSGTLKLHNVDEKTAAMIMAIVSDESKIPLSELCFKSIKAIEET